MSELQPLPWKTAELSPEQRKELLINEVLDYASSGNLIPFMDNVLNGKLEIDQKDKLGHTVIHLAVLYGKFDIVQNLLDKAACPVDLPNSMNQTPLILACTRGFINTIKLLLDRGANIEYKDDLGVSPVLASIVYGQVKALMLLVGRGASIEVEDKNGAGGIHWAAYRNQVYVLRVLKELGLELKKKDVNGRNPLHWAAVTGCWKAAEFLLFNGVDADDEDNKGKKPADLAIESKAFAVATLISNYNKDGNPLNAFFTYIFTLFWVSLYYIYYTHILEHTTYRLIPSLGFNFCILWILPLFILCKFSNCSTQDLTTLDSNSPISETLSENLYENIEDFTDICPTCHIKRAPRSKHCKFIDKCVQEYDHHCYFLGKTIGKGNKKVFFFGLFVNFSACGLFLVVCWLMLNDRVAASGYICTYFGRMFIEFWQLESQVKGMIVVCILVWWYSLWYLVLVTYSILNALTVNEVVNRQRYRYLYTPYLALDDTVKMQFKNPFSKGFYTNFLEFIIN